MLIDLFLGIIFLGSCFALWYRISQKIPEVIAIHDDVITQRLHENSARFRIFFLHFKTFYKEEYYRSIFWNFLGKIFYKIHILILRIDNSLIGVLKKIRTRGGLAGLAVSEQEMHEQAAPEIQAADEKKTANYWDALKEDDPTTHAQTQRKRHIEGVRMRTRKTPVKSGLPEEKEEV